MSNRQFNWNTYSHSSDSLDVNLEDGSVYSHDNITNISNNTNNSNHNMDILPINNEEQYAIFDTYTDTDTDTDTETDDETTKHKNNIESSYVKHILSFEYIKKCHTKYWWLNILIVIILLIIFAMLIYNLYPIKTKQAAIVKVPYSTELSLPSKLSTTSSFTL